MNRRTDTRREVIRAIRAAMRERGRTITDSDARAMLRGEASTAEYRIAYQIARQFGLEDF